MSGPSAVVAALFLFFIVTFDGRHARRTTVQRLRPFLSRRRTPGTAAGIPRFVGAGDQGSQSSTVCAHSSRSRGFLVLGSSVLPLRARGQRWRKNYEPSYTTLDSRNQAATCRGTTRTTGQDVRSVEDTKCMVRRRTSKRLGTRAWSKR